MHKGGVRLTGDLYWRIEKPPIPGYDEEDLGDTPFTSPDIFDFTIKEYQPVVYLVTGNRSIREWLKNCLRCHKCSRIEGLTKSANMEA